jgi:hypothetical protein
LDDDDGTYIYTESESNGPKMFTLLIEIGVIAGKNSPEDTLVLSLVVGKCAELNHSVFENSATFRKDLGNQWSIGGSTRDVV